LAARAIIDTGLIAALWDPRDSLHEWAREAAARAPGPWLTCEACVTEMAFLLSGRGGPSAVLKLFGHLAAGSIRTRHLLPEGLMKVAAEIARYRDRRVDFADACLVVLSDEHPDLPVVTADRSDFQVYFRGRTPRTLITP
jgi:predicted nucleic acid-binding protein